MFPRELEGRMRAKLGLADERPGDRELVEGVLQLLAAGAVDYPVFWRRLSRFAAAGGAELVRDLFLDRNAFDSWLRTIRGAPAGRARVAGARMLRSNPKYVLRNHLCELAIRQAKLGDFSEVEACWAWSRRPSTNTRNTSKAGFPPDWASHIEISCSS